MGEYDVALKSVIRRMGRPSLRALTDLSIDRWHNVELPEVRDLRLDLLGETAEQQLVHIELQSTNESRMALRMLEYATAVCRQFDRFPEQIVLYFGSEPARMGTRLAGSRLAFEYRLADIREFDAEAYLSSDVVASDVVEDNIIGFLASVRGEREAVQRVLRRIAASDPSERRALFAEFFILAGLRKMGAIIQEEARRMPILDDIMDHDVIGREFKRGEIAVVLSLIERRFGIAPEWLVERLNAMSVSEVRSFAVRLLDVRSLEELAG